MNDGEKIQAMADELRAYWLYKKGRREEAFLAMEKKPSRDLPMDRALFLGQTAAGMGRWDEAVTYLMLMVDNRAPLSSDQSRTVSDCLLMAAAHYSRAEDWPNTLTCLDAAGKLCPNNPCLGGLPVPGPDDQAVLLFRSGKYRKAIDLLEDWNNDRIKDSGRRHILALACQCAVEADESLPLEEKFNLIEQGNMYWTALVHDRTYWRSFYDKRQSVYEGKVSLDDFLATAPLVGGQRCEGWLQRLQADFEEAQDAQNLQMLGLVKDNMAVERHSASLLAEIKPDWPTGGLRMLRMLWGQEAFQKAMQGTLDGVVGSKGWLLKGLGDAQCAPAFISFLNGDYLPCFTMGRKYDAPDIVNLMGLAVIKRAEAAIADRNTAGCRELAPLVARVQNGEIRREAARLLEEMAVLRLNNFLAAKEYDQAGEFLESILSHFPPQSNIDMSRLKDSFLGVLLRAAEKKYDDGDIPGWLDEYDRAVATGGDRALCEKDFQKIAGHHLGKLFKDRKWSEIYKFLEMLRARYPENKYLKGQQHLHKGLEKREKTGQGGHPEVLRQFEAAYNADPGNDLFANLYSNALSNRAVDMVNEVLGSRNPNVYSAKATLREAMTMLTRALTIDKTNEHARNNMVQLMDIQRKIGM